MTANTRRRNPSTLSKAASTPSTVSIEEAAQLHRDRLRALSEKGDGESRPSKLAVESPPQRKKKLNLLRDLLVSPPFIDFVREPIHCSSTVDEIAARRKDLEYRLSWLAALTDMTRTELQLLDQAIPIDHVEEKCPGMEGHSTGMDDAESTKENPDLNFGVNGTE